MSSPSRSLYSDREDVRMQSSSHRAPKIWSTPRDTLKESRKTFARKHTLGQVPNPATTTPRSQPRGSMSNPLVSRLHVSTVEVPASSRTGFSSARDLRKMYPNYRGRTKPKVNASTSCENESILISSSDEEIEEIHPATRTPPTRTSPTRAPPSTSAPLTATPVTRTLSRDESDEIQSRVGTGVMVKKLAPRTFSKRLPKFRFLKRNELGESVDRMMTKMSKYYNQVAGVSSDYKSTCLGLFHKYDEPFSMGTSTGPSISVPVKTIWLGSHEDVLVSKILMSMNQVDMNKIASNVNCLWYESSNQSTLVGLRPCQFVRFSTLGDYIIRQTLHNLVSAKKQKPVNTETLQNDNIIILFIDDNWNDTDDFYNFLNSNCQNDTNFTNMPSYQHVELGQYEKRLRCNFAINEEVERQKIHPNPVIDDRGTHMCQCYVILPSRKDYAGKTVRRREGKFRGRNKNLELIPTPESIIAPSRHNSVRNRGEEIIGVEVEPMEIYLIKQQQQVCDEMEEELVEQQVIEEQLEVENWMGDLDQVDDGDESSNKEYVVLDESMDDGDHLGTCDSDHDDEESEEDGVEEDNNEVRPPPHEIVIDLCADEDENDEDEETEPVRKLCVYPSPPERSQITITSRDLMTLDAGKYINDVIVDFYMIWMARNVYKSEKVLMLSSFFYQRLACWDTPADDDDVDDETEDGKRWRHAQVEKWTRNEDIFDKEFIFIPISRNEHWFLVIICNPGLREGRLRLKKPSKVLPGEVCVSKFGLFSSSKDTDISSDYCNLTPEQKQDIDVVVPQLNFVDQNCNKAGKYLFKFTSMYEYREPCILLLDSLASHFTKEEKLEVVNNLAGYLDMEWKKKREATHGKRNFNIRAIAPHVPQQTNSYDCGIYMLHYVEKFLQNPLLHYLLPLKSLDSWIEKDDIKQKRKEIQRLINFLPPYQDTSDDEMRTSDEEMQ